MEFLWLYVTPLGSIHYSFNYVCSSRNTYPKNSAAIRVRIKLENIFLSYFEIEDDPKQPILKARSKSLKINGCFCCCLISILWSVQNHFTCSVLNWKGYSPSRTSITDAKTYAMESQCRRQKEDSACRMFKEMFDQTLQKDKFLTSLFSFRVNLTEICIQWVGVSFFPSATLNTGYVLFCFFIQLLS